jgi:hypothetical protein
MDSPSPEGALFVTNKLLLEAASYDQTDGHHLQNSFDTCAAVFQSVNEGTLINNCRFIVLILNT